MNRLPRSLTNSKNTLVELGNCNDGVTPNYEISGDSCWKLVGTAHNQQAQNLINGKKRKEVDTSNMILWIGLYTSRVFLLVYACDFLCFSYFKYPHQIILFE